MNTQLANSLLFSRCFAASLQNISRSPQHGLLNHARVSYSTPRSAILIASDPFLFHRWSHTFSAARHLNWLIPRPSLPSILRFVPNKARYATHRSSRISRIPFNAGRAQSRGPIPPRGPQGAWQRFREQLDAIPNAAIFWSILALNGAVYVAWNLAYFNYVRRRLQSVPLPCCISLQRLTDLRLK